MIQEPSATNEPNVFKNLKNLYKACMNVSAIEADGSKTLKEILRELGGWPVLEGSTWNENAFDWKETLYKFLKKGFSIDYLINFSVTADARNSSIRVIEVSIKPNFRHATYFMFVNS